ncbi:MAG: hypothetical protein G01um101472_600 [Parcubacteria group bacterium Gr01-1014_72]|nr:MAG: hypothetical protein G01um101472_600 [Parcubacteria group bacterium Gr01-1014_72]
MAYRDGGGANPMDDVKWIFGILIVLAVAWYATGGLESERATKGPFMKPLAPVGTGEIYGSDIGAPLRNRGGGSSSGGETKTGTGGSDTGADGTATGRQEETALTSQFSKLRGKIIIESVQSGSRTDASDEYIVLSASLENTDRVPITGLVLRSVPTGKGATIGSGISLPTPGQASGAEPVYLGPGERVLVTTGRSPNGLSFRLNKCTGYFEQFQNFTPGLPANCPHPSREKLPEPPNNLDDACLEFLENMNYCQVVVEFQQPISDTCHLYLGREISYNKCLEKHRSDKDFFSGEWRLFLARDAGLWKNSRETIRLLDQNGKIVDEYTY